MSGVRRRERGGVAEGPCDWLEGWGLRVRALFDAPQPPSAYDWMCFLPDSLALDAMTQLATANGEAIRQVRDALDVTNACFEEFRRTGDGDAVADFASATSVLAERIEAAVSALRTPQTAGEGRQGGNSPRWDGERGELSYRGKLLKTYRQRAQNQRGILAAFQAEGWPARIENPLSGGQKQLCDSLAALNKDLAALRFSGSGDGGICWEPRTE